jgi:phosphoribosylglycinamide formyltransferase 1
MLKYFWILNLIKPSRKGVEMKKVLVFASGSSTGGGSGAARLVEESRKRPLGFEVVAFVTHHADGGVVKHARRLDIPCEVVAVPVLMAHYVNLVRKYDACLVALSGWLKPVSGLPPEMVINIHPGPFPTTSGLYGHHVHERMIRVRDEDGISITRVTMHFVTPFMRKPDGTNNYDTGEIFASIPVEIHSDDTADTLAKRVDAVEHQVQAIYTSLVASSKIALRNSRVLMADELWLHGINLPTFE